ncbi:MAG: hypothetical protein WD696_15415 [Bryobacteraceae bacterium]
MKSASREKGGILTGLLIGLGLLAGLVVFLAWTGIHLARNLHVEHTRKSNAESTRIVTPIGSIHVTNRRGVDAKHFGVPVYPGARQTEEDSRSASVELDLGSSHHELAIVAAHYVTSDSVEKVVEYYRGILPHWIVSKDGNRKTRIEYTEDGYKRLIAIREKHGQTRIALASFGEPASN